MAAGTAARSVSAVGRPSRILIADNRRRHSARLERALIADGHVVTTAHDGVEALEAVAALFPDMVIMEVEMPSLDGLALCTRLKNDALTRLLPVVLMSRAGDHMLKVRALEAGADDFVFEPLRIAELRARVRSLTRLKRYTDDLDSAESMLFTLARTIEARDALTGGHCERLAERASRLGEALGLDVEQCVALRRGGFLHDLGKIAIPDAVLLKTGLLTAAEFEVMKQHTVIGDTLCGGLRGLRLVRPIIRHHHERFDGSGYPDGLSGDDIPLLAQVMHVVDVFDALTTARLYREALPPNAAIECLREEAARGWHRSDLVEAFIAQYSDVPRPDTRTTGLDRMSAIPAPVMVKRGL